MDATVTDVVTADTPAPIDAAVALDGTFSVAIFFQPLPSLTSDAVYADIAHFGVDLVYAVNTDGTLASNAPMLAAAARNHVGLVVRDTRIGGAPPSNGDVDDVVSVYNGMAGLAGYYVRDEPAGSQLPGYGDVYRRLLARDPLHVANYLNLFPAFASESLFFVPRTAVVSQTGASDGTYVTPTTTLSQTFVTSSMQRSIDSIVLNIDAGQWTDEPLTLQLFDGATLVASRTMRNSNNGNFPHFAMQTSVLPAHPYRWVLSHGGGADNSVGWVTRSSSDTYANGTGSVGAAETALDFYFELLDAPSDARDTAQRSGGQGDYVTAAAPMGQTFVVPADSAYPLRSIELDIDPNTWAADETLTLTVWDSPSRLTAFARSSLSGSNNGYYPRFDLDAHLAPGATYYFELTHGGGGDGSVGWVVFSSGDGDPALRGYRGDAPQSWDLVFRAFYGLGVYDTYVDTWLTAGTPTMLIFDHYPFRASGDAPDYFWNLALVRDRAVAHHTPFMGYVQSVRWEGMRAPTASELRWNAFTTLAFGASGIAYFTYADPVVSGSEHFDHSIVNADATHGGLFDAGTALNHEIHAFGRVLGGARNDGVYVAGSALPSGLAQLPPDAPRHPMASSSSWLIGLFTLADGRRSAMIVNLDHDAAHAGRFTWPAMPSSLLEVSRTDGALADAAGYDATSGALSTMFAAGDAHVVVWTP